MTYPTTEQVEKARQASLADFFIQNGFEAELTRNKLHVKGYGGLYINTETNEWYCFSQADKRGGKNARIEDLPGVLKNSQFLSTKSDKPHCDLAI